MNRTLPPDENAKFSGNLRHYHRTGAQTQKSWDDWVDGAAVTTRKSRNWLKIAGIVIAALALSGIVAGLIIELS